MTHFAFKRSCALIIATVFSFVFICSPCEGQEKERRADAKGESTIAAPDGSLPGGSIFPKQDYTVLIVLGAVAVGLLVYLIVRPGKEAKAAKLEDLDSVLTTPSSLNFVGTRVPLGDSLSSFSMAVDVENAKTIFDGNVSVAFRQAGGRSILSFTNVVGVADDPSGPYAVTSIVVNAGDEIYLKVNDKTVYRVHVKEETRGTATLVFERL